MIYMYVLIGTIKVKVEEKVEKKIVVLDPLLDYTEIVTYIWTDGIRDPDTGRYLPGYSPNLTKRDYTGAGGGGVINLAGGGVGGGIKEGKGMGMAMGGRSVGALEELIGDRSTTFQPAVERPEIVSEATLVDLFQNEISGITKTTPAESLKADVNERNLEEGERDEEEEDDDFFGVVKSRKSIKKVPLSPLPLIPPTVMLPSLVNGEGGAAPGSQEPVPVPLPLTKQEIADVKKNKKQRVVSVQARLAERQSFLLKKQQDRQELIDGGKEKQRLLEQR